MAIEYRVNPTVSAECLIALFEASGLGDRRPVDDPECIRGMLANSNLLVTAWHGAALIGAARSVTDFYYVCYLSDLAVHGDWQRCGVGTRLQVVTQRQLGPRCKLVLIAAPGADDYYAHLGFTRNQRCWVLE